MPPERGPIRSPNYPLASLQNLPKQLHLRCYLLVTYPVPLGVHVGLWVHAHQPHLGWRGPCWHHASLTGTPE
eukprot:2134958-Pyramimonas_sp.AAC.1